MEESLKGAFGVLLITAVVASVSAQQPGESRTSDQDRRAESAGTRTIAVLGSSVARGWVTSYEAKHDLLNGYAFRLARLLEPRGWKVVNISVPGDDTKAVLARIESDLLPLQPEIVIIGLSMSNEGLETATNPKTVFKRYKSGLQKVIKVCRQNGIAPVVGLCYPNDNYDERHYASIKKMNLLINSWDVPSINLLGPVDNRSGGWVEGYTFDLDHPDDIGHAEMFYAIVPSLFDAVAAGKPVPKVAKSKEHVTIDEPRGPSPISFVPDDVMHSFTIRFEVRPRAGGVVAMVNCGKHCAHLDVNDDGFLRYVSAGGEKVTAGPAMTDGRWHDVALSHRHLLGVTELFLDGKSLGGVTERLEPRRFVIGGPGDCPDSPNAASADYRNLMIYRSPLNPDEVEALNNGRLLRASLEAYAPLDEELLNDNRPLANLAQSLSQVIAYPADENERIARLEEKINRAARAKRYVDPNAKTPVEVDPAIFKAYVGEYEVDSRLTLLITEERGRLLLSPNGMGKTQLHPESETKFFARIMGPEIGVTFVKGADGAVGELILHQGKMDIPAKRVR